MIIGGKKQAVVANMRRYAKQGQLNHKVEVHDAHLTLEQSRALMKKYVQLIQTPRYRLYNCLARLIANQASAFINRHAIIQGVENLQTIDGSAIVTSNHFNPLENTLVRKTLWQAHRHQLYILSEDTNLLTGGPLGFLLKYYDTIPVSPDLDYSGRVLPQLIKQALADHNYVLIYPEQEMWFNYRKPRPPKRGAYYYAARFNVPIISCFVEIRDLNQPDNDEFNHTQMIMHVLKPIYPDPQQSVRENSHMMMTKDYAQKAQAYEKIYGEKLTYDWEDGDVVGWRKG